METVNVAPTNLLSLIRQEYGLVIENYLQLLRSAVGSHVCAAWRVADMVGKTLQEADSSRIQRKSSYSSFK